MQPPAGRERISRVSSENSSGRVPNRRIYKHMDSSLTPSLRTQCAKSKEYKPGPTKYVNTILEE